jgi:hypothetical protein
MKYIVPIEGLAEGKVMVDLDGIFSGPKLYVNNMPATRAEKKDEYLIKKEDGKEIVVKFKNKFFDPVPNIVVDGREIVLAVPIKWYQWIWAGLPILLVFGGGAIGGATGFAAASISTRIFRSEMNKAAQYGLVALVSLGAVVTYFILAALFTALIQ